MAMDGGTAGYVAAILNAGYMVRHHSRGGRSSISRPERSRAILQLGVVVRDAFTNSDDYEALLAAVVDALRPRDDPPF
jgi:hypothetical protein